MASLELSPSVFSIPPRLRCAGPATLLGSPSLSQSLVLWAWSRAAWESRECSSPVSSSFPLLSMGPELVVVLKLSGVCACFYC